MQSSDQFVLAKGHSVGALYIVLWSIGRLSDADLKEFHKITRAWQDILCLAGCLKLQWRPEAWAWLSCFDGHGSRQTVTTTGWARVLFDVRWRMAGRLELKF